MFTKLGYKKNLFILPFDHRSSFAKIFQNKEAIISAKLVIYEAFKKAVSNGISKDDAAILIDEEFGDRVILDAKNNGFTTILTTEKSGQKEFTFEYGNDFQQHIEKYKPTFAKALIRYNPEGNEALNKRQQRRLKILCDYCHNNGYRVLIESLIPPTTTQLRKIKNDAKAFNNEVRPSLTVKLIKQLQEGGIEPDVWKLEGMNKIRDYEQVVKQTRSGGRRNVGTVVLGRGESRTQVEQWLRIGAQVDGVIGFAIGRTVFWDPLIYLKDGKISKEETINQIAKNFKYFYDIFRKSKNRNLPT